MDGQGQQVDPNVDPAPAPSPDPAPADPAGIDTKAVREHKLFIQLAREKAKLEEQLTARDAAARKAEEERLQAQGEFKTLAEQRAAELESVKAQHARDLLTRDADLALVKAGITHAAARRGFVADYLSTTGDDRPDPETWAEAIKADPINAIFFSTNAPPVGAGPNAGAATRAGAVALDERLNSTDPAIRKAAQAEWMRKNMPGAQN